MPGKQYTGGDWTYLYIIGGNICQNVEKDSEGARRRDWETKDGKKGTKYELVYRSWEAMIKSLTFKDTDYGTQLNVEMEDATLTLPTDSRYFSDFAKKVKSLDLTKPVEFAPYDWEPEPGKRSIGINLLQGGKKVTNYYWNDVDSTWVHGIPQPVGETKYFKSDDWKRKRYYY